MVPNGWVSTSFNHHIDCLTGYAFKSSDYSDSSNSIKLLRGDNIEPGRLRWRDAKFWSVDRLDGLSQYYLEEGDFVIALDRTWVSNGLKVAEVNALDMPCLLVQRVIRIRAKNTLEQSLLKQYFSGNQFEQYVKSVQTATAVPHISPNDIKDFPVLLPPLSEQQKIAQILSTWDQAIAVTESLLENSQQQKKALMQQLLTGKKRLLDENGVRFGGEWQEVLLGNIAKITTGSSNRQDSNLNGQYTFFDRSEDIRTSNIYLFDCEAVIVAGEGQDFVPKYFIGKFDLHQRTYAIMDFIDHDGKFLFYLIHYSRYYFLSQAVGSTVKSLRLPMFQKMKISVPTINEQKKIAAVLSTADQEIQALQQKLDCLKQEKKALMQQLLTGKRRVKFAA